MNYKRILAYAILDYIKDSGAENYFPEMSFDIIFDTLSDEVVEKFQQMIIGAATT